MEEIEFFMCIDHDGESKFYTKHEVQYHVKSDSDNFDELIELWMKIYQTIKLIRMRGIPYENK